MKAGRWLAVIVIPALAACGGTARAPEGTAIAEDAPYEVVSEAALEPGALVPEPVGEEILTISGEIGTTNDRGRLAFDMATLESLGLVSYDVEDPWDQKEVTYTGVLMSELLAVAGAASDARSVRIVALDDYRVSIPIDEIHRWPVLLATRADGEVIGVESGGPSRIIYPYGTFPEIDGVTHDDLWIWSVERMTIR